MDKSLTMSMFATRNDFERAQAQRNLDPHKPACVAMLLWSKAYASSGLGSMQFWDSLSDGAKDQCRCVVEWIAKARAEQAAGGG